MVKVICRSICILSLDCPVMAAWAAAEVSQAHPSTPSEFETLVVQNFQ